MKGNACGVGSHTHGSSLPAYGHTYIRVCVSVCSNFVQVTKLKDNKENGKKKQQMPFLSFPPFVPFFFSSDNCITIGLVACRLHLLETE